MAECAVARCTQEKRIIRKELQKWAKNLLFCVGFEQVAQQYMGPKRFERMSREYPTLSLDQSQTRDAVRTDPVDWDPNDDSCYTCVRKKHLLPVDPPSDNMDIPSETDVPSDDNERLQITSSPHPMDQHNPHHQDMLIPDAHPASSSSSHPHLIISGPDGKTILSDPKIHHRHSMTPTVKNEDDDVSGHLSDQPLDLSMNSRSRISPTRSIQTSIIESNEKSSTPLLKVPQVNPTTTRKSREGVWKRNYSEAELESALNDIISGKLGTRRAAVIYGIPRSTLRNKVYKMDNQKTNGRRRGGVASAASTSGGSSLMPPSNSSSEKPKVAIPKRKSTGTEKSGVGTHPVASSSSESLKQILKKTIGKKNAAAASSGESILEPVVNHNPPQQIFGADMNFGINPNPVGQDILSALMQPQDPNLVNAIRNLLLLNLPQLALANFGAAAADGTGLGASDYSNRIQDVMSYMTQYAAFAALASRGVDSLGLVMGGGVDQSSHPSTFQNMNQPSYNSLNIGNESINSGAVHENQKCNPFGLQSLMSDDQINVSPAGHKSSAGDKNRKSTRVVNIVPKPEQPELHSKESSLSHETSVNNSSVSNGNVILNVPSFRPKAYPHLLDQLKGGQHTPNHNLFSDGEDDANNNRIWKNEGEDEAHDGEDDEQDVRIDSKSSHGIKRESGSLMNFPNIKKEALSYASSVNSEESNGESLLIPKKTGNKSKRGTKSSYQHNQNENSDNQPSEQTTGDDNNGNRNRPKRGRYRNYNRDALAQAVQAVKSGAMSVHRAGTHFGVPHSTLEYKVKDRHLDRPAKKRTAAQISNQTPENGSEAADETSSNQTVKKARSSSTDSTPSLTSDTNNNSLASSVSFWPNNTIPHDGSPETVKGGSLLVSSSSPAQQNNSNSDTNHNPTVTSNFFASNMIRKLQESVLMNQTDDGESPERESSSSLNLDHSRSSPPMFANISLEKLIKTSLDKKASGGEPRDHSGMDWDVSGVIEREIKHEEEDNDSKDDSNGSVNSSLAALKEVSGIETDV